MNKHVMPTLLAAASFCVAANAVAAPFLPLDPRTLGMGGAGVASGTSANAALNNPALLAAAHDDEDFSLELPVAGAGLADPEKLFDALADFGNNNYVLNFSNAMQAFNTEFTTQAQALPTPPDLARLDTARDEVVRTGHELLGGFQSLSDKAVRGNGNLSAVVGIPSKSLGVSVFANAWATGGARGEMTESDVSASNQVLAQMEAIDLTSPAAALISLGSFQPITDPSSTFSSFAEARFAVFGEAGVALAREVSLLDGLAVGITPKFVRVWTYDFKYIAREMQAGRSFDLKEGEKNYNSFNVDAGIARDFHNGWKTGLVLKNVIPRSYKTALGNDIDVNPQLRLGAARQIKWASVSVDLDVTKNKPVDFEGDTRYLSVGAELDAWHLAQVRLGFRRNLAGDSGLLAFGLGLSPFGVHIDAGIAASRDEIAAGVQTGFRF